MANSLSADEMKNKILKRRHELERAEHNNNELKDHLVTMVDMMINLIEGGCDPADCHKCELIDEAKKIKVTIVKDKDIKTDPPTNG
jgi:hypothetical protein